MAPPDPTDVPVTAKGCATIVGASLLLWFVLYFLFLKGAS